MASSTFCSLLQILLYIMQTHTQEANLIVNSTWSKCSILKDLGFLRSLMCPSWLISNLVPPTVRYDHHVIHSHSFWFGVFPHPSHLVGMFSMFSSKKKKSINQTCIHVTHDCHLILNLFCCWIILAKQLNKSGENTAHQRSRILQTKDIYDLSFSSLKILWLLLEIRKPLQLWMAFGASSGWMDQLRQGR